MTVNDPVADSPADDAAPSRRELAVARSLDPARARAEKRVQRFLDAALELMQTAPDREFTVQEVVEHILEQRHDRGEGPGRLLRVSGQELLGELGHGPGRVRSGRPAR
ncbi:MAG: hypothetical protein ABW143_03865, partial [Acidimicrobiales bacterium]